MFTRSMLHIAATFLSPFHQHGLTLMPPWISIRTPSKVWGDITHPFPNFNDCIVQVWESVISTKLQIITCRLHGAKPLPEKNVGILLIGPLGTDFSEILNEICTLSFKKMLLKMSSGSWRPVCLGPNVLQLIDVIKRPPWRLASQRALSNMRLRVKSFCEKHQ